MDLHGAMSVIEVDAHDDTYGLWEVPWMLQEAFPDESEADRLVMAKKSLRALIDLGHIDVYRGVTFTGVERVVVGAERDNALEDEWWVFRGTEEHTAVATSAARARELLSVQP